MKLIDPYLYAGLSAENQLNFKNPRIKKLRPVEIDRIIELEFNTSVSNLTVPSFGKGGGRRREEQVIPRQLWQYLLRKYTDLTVKQIGKKTNRDHSTIIHSTKKITHILEWEKDIYHERFKALIERI